jgi:hypothetical protein
MQPVSGFVIIDSYSLVTHTHKKEAHSHLSTLKVLRLKQVASSSGPCSPNDRKRCVAKRLKRCHQDDDQQLSLSSSSLTTRVEKLNIKDILTHRHKMFIAHRARIYWKQIAREMAIDENDISEIDGTSDDRALSTEKHLDLDCSKQKQLYNILNIWIDKIGIANATTTQLMHILSKCKLNSIKGTQFLIKSQRRRIFHSWLLSLQKTFVPRSLTSLPLIRSWTSSTSKTTQCTQSQYN